MPTQADAPHPDGATVTTSVSASEGQAFPRDATEIDGPLVLRDGTVLRQRAIRADDAPRLQAFHSRLSWQTIRYRFFGVMPVLNSELAERLSHVDYENRMAVVATVATLGDERRDAEADVDANMEAPIVAVVRYQRTGPEVAEFALVVEDGWQGRGIGPLLLRTLAAYAYRQGYTTLTADVMYDNDHMLALLRHRGYPTALRLHDGRVEARLDLAHPDPDALRPTASAGHAR